MMPYRTAEPPAEDDGQALLEEARREVRRARLEERLARVRTPMPRWFYTRRSPWLPLLRGAGIFVLPLLAWFLASLLLGALDGATRALVRYHTEMRLFGRTTHPLPLTSLPIFMAAIVTLGALLSSNWRLLAIATGVWTLSIAVACVRREWWGDPETLEFEEALQGMSAFAPSSIGDETT